MLKKFRTSEFWIFNSLIIFIIDKNYNNSEKISKKLILRFMISLMS